MFRHNLRKMLAAAGVDRAVAFTVLNQGWLSVAGLVGLVIVGKHFSPAEQGYYYTIASLLALQIFAELGLSNVILQFASHEAAHLKVTPRGIESGPDAARSRLASILRFSLAWYGIAGVILLAVLLPAGYYFLHAAAPDSRVGWQYPWMLTLLATAAYLFVTPALALLQGCGMVAEVARFRLAQAVAAHTALWCAILSGFGLASAAVFSFTMLTMAVAWLALRFRRLAVELLTLELRETVEWREEIWPYQWRIAISWLCGFFIFQIFTPLVFAFHGPIEAGRMGMSLTIAGAVSATGLAWLSTRAPKMGQLVSLGRLPELDALFTRSLKQAAGVSALAACGAIALTWLVAATHHPFADRMLPIWPTVFLLLASFVNLIVTAEATYLRAFKQEPFLVVSIANAVLTTTVAVVISATGTAREVAFGYLIVDATVGLGLGTYVFQVKRREWRRLRKPNGDGEAHFVTCVATAA